MEESVKELVTENNVNNTNFKIFSNEEFGSIRTVAIDGEPWFVGKDVAEALGYKDINHAVLDHVEVEDRINSKTQGQNAPEFGQRGTWLINESGLYSLILSSKLPSAKKFKRWITSEVIPTIRKTGGYVANKDLFFDTYMPGVDERTKQIFIQSWRIINDLNVKIRQDEPKVAFADRVADSSNTISLGEMAKLLKDEDLDMGRNRLFKFLRKKGVLMKGNLPYQKYIQLNYFKVSERVIKTAYRNVTSFKVGVTGRGQIFITEMVRKEFKKTA